MNKAEIARIIGAVVVGGTIGTYLQYRSDKKRIDRFRPLMTNALFGLLVDVHTNPNLTPEQIREKTEVELEFLKIAMK